MTAFFTFIAACDLLDSESYQNSYHKDYKSKNDKHYFELILHFYQCCNKYH